MHVLRAALLEHLNGKVPLDRPTWSGVVPRREQLCSLSSTAVGTMGRWGGVAARHTHRAVTARGGHEASGERVAAEAQCGLAGGARQHCVC